jgi:hypothetical protein
MIASGEASMNEREDDGCSYGMPLGVAGLGMPVAFLFQMVRQFPFWWAFRIA